MKTKMMSWTKLGSTLASRVLPTLGRRRAPSRRTVVLSRARLPLLVGGGALLGYLLDPELGRGRRRRLMDQSAARARRATRRLRARASYAEGRLHGTVVRMRGGGRPDPVDDVEVKHQVQQALSRAGLQRRDVIVDVAHRTATLRGELPTEEQIARAEEATASVPGVAEVVSNLHVPGQPAPHKVVALHA